MRIARLRPGLFALPPQDFRSDDTALVLVDHQVGTITWAGPFLMKSPEEIACAFKDLLAGTFATPGAVYLSVRN